jgi:hypothetical protein
VSDQPIIGQDYDPDFSHAMLVAVLVRLGGSIELTAEDLEADALGDGDGTLFRMILEPRPDRNTLRLSVVPAARTDTSGG